MRSWIAATATAVLTAGAPGLAAQSLFATRGLGVPVAPVDARARALGGMGIGLLGLDMSLVNPADVAGLGRRGVVAALQPGTASADVGGATGDLASARFPLIRLVYPVSRRVVASLGYGSFLEQSWGIDLAGREVIGTDTVDVSDVIEAIGGVARLALGAAFQVSPAVALGVAGGFNTGNVDRRVTRIFADSLIGLQPFDTRLRWNYSGAFWSAGVRADVQDFARVGASITYSEPLEIDGREAEARDDRSDIPLRLAAGASAAVSSTLLAAIGTEWNRGEGRVFEATDASALRRSTWRVGGGLEYEGVRTQRRFFPIRLGASWAELPYYNEGETPGTEWSAAVGIGFRLAGDQAGPLAVADLALERGGRSGLESSALPDGLRESFWRVTFSLSLFGN